VGQVKQNVANNIKVSKQKIHKTQYFIFATKFRVKRDPNLFQSV